MPAAQPVTYVLDDGEVVFRTAVGGALAHATRLAVVAFQIDEVDHGSRTGWSVLGVGQTHQVIDSARLDRVGDRLPGAQVPAHTVAVPMLRLSGHRWAWPAPD